MAEEKKAVDLSVLFPDFHAIFLSRASADFPDELKFDVLQETFIALLASSHNTTGCPRPVDFRFQLLAPEFKQEREGEEEAEEEGNGFRRFSRMYEYDGRSWTGTITHHITKWQGVSTYFIKVRIRHDDYLAQESDEQKQDGEEEEEEEGVARRAQKEATRTKAYALLENLLQTLLAFKPQGFQFTGDISRDEEVIVMFNVAKKSLTVIFQDTLNRKCFSVEWVHGLCENMPRKQEGVQTKSRFAEIAKKYGRAA